MTMSNESHNSIRSNDRSHTLDRVKTVYIPTCPAPHFIREHTHGPSIPKNLAERIAVQRLMSLPHGTIC